MFSFYLKTRLVLGQMALMRLVFLILILYTTKVSSRANRRIKQWPNETYGAKYPEEEEIQTAPRIAGGRDAPEGRFPYMCSLKRTRGEEHICGGTLIRPQWVLTAAHCVDPHRSLSEFTPLVHVGSHLLNDPDAEELAADETVVHCGWNGNVLDGADIALIKLHKRSRNKFARLPAAGSESFEGELYSALGWGQSRERQGFAETLQTLDELLYVSEQTCNTFKIYHGQIDQRMLCAVAPSGDTCSGDSGGPLLEINDFREVEKGNPELDIVVGITSHGPTDCNSTQGPGVYTRVAAYREWIDRVIQSDGDWNCNLRQSKEDKTETEHAEEETHDTERIANCAEQTSDNIDHSVISIEHIGGVFSSRPSCLNIHNGRVDCYIRTVDADLFHIAKVDDQLIAQQKLGSPIVDAPECVSLASTHMDCFTLGVDGPNLRNIWWYANSSFVAWREHGGRLLETPSCLTRSGDRVACFARGIDNTPLMKEYDAARGGWQDFQPLTGTLLAPFACGSAGDFIDCLGAGNGLEIHHVRLRGGEFSQNWRPLGAKSRFRPAILHPGARTVEAFIVNLEGKMAHATFNGRRWSNWTVVEGAVASEPECVASSETMFHCFAIGTSGRLMHTYNDGDEWSMWRSTTERFQDKPSCFKYSQSQIRCYLRDDESSLGEVIYEVPPGLNNDVLCDSREDL